MIVRHEDDSQVMSTFLMRYGVWARESEVLDRSRLSPRSCHRANCGIWMVNSGELYVLM